MAANTTPIFTLTPNIGTGITSGSNPASDGSGTLVTVFTAGANGSRLDYIKITNAQVTPAASTAMVIRAFVTDTDGNNPRLIGEVALATATRTASVIGATSTISFANGLNLKSGQLVKIAQSAYAGLQDLLHYVAVGGDY